AMAAAGAVRAAELRRGVIDTTSLVRAISGLEPFSARKRMSEAGMLLVDGRGASRIAKYARSLVLSERITVRPAVSGDMTAVHRLSNEPSVRASSINTSRITLTGHRKWFEEKIKDPDCLFLAAEYLGGFVGQVRFARGKEDAVVSISVSGKMRGTGAGRVILEKALSRFRQGYPGAGVLAYIKKDNIPSRRLFEGCGFVRIGEPKVNGRKMLLYRDSGRPGKRSVA
ncbi:MAG TPA: GNAT family N-acetyltransferase, partial [Elusimicrobiales bacterium]|nr:GNAT family N-acetyltransferase [Elusimicrobiales bacterium]